MYAVFQNGGKQYRVSIGCSVRLEKIGFKHNKNIEFNKVLMLVDNNSIKIGKPFIDNVKIKATIIKQGREKKIKIIKYRRRKHSCKQQGHRQYFTDVRIININ